MESSAFLLSEGNSAISEARIRLTSAFPIRDWVVTLKSPLNELDMARAARGQREGGGAVERERGEGQRGEGEGER
eukprot:scaffold10326_cov31-Tisochrysis_lutea.AAC.1